MWFSFAWKKGLMAMNFLLVRGMKRYGNKRSMQMKSTTERASGKSIFILNRKWRLECVTNKAKRGKKSGVFLGYLNFTWGELWVRVNHSIFDFLIAFFRTCWKSNQNQCTQRECRLSEEIDLKFEEEQQQKKNRSRARNGRGWSP